MNLEASESVDEIRFTNDERRGHGSSSNTPRRRVAMAREAVSANAVCVAFRVRRCDRNSKGRSERRQVSPYAIVVLLLRQHQVSPGSPIPRSCPAALAARPLGGWPRGGMALGSW